MAVVVGEDNVLPLTLPEATDSLHKIIVDIFRKNRTMVDYYIYPKETPSEIEAYQPRLQVLYSRVETLAALDLKNLNLLVDNAAALISAFLLPIIDQLLNAVHGIQQIFINHYDRDLENRKPYATVYSTLEYRERQLKKFQTDQMSNPQRRLPEANITTPQSTAEPMFCRFAIAFANHRDHGKLSQVLSEDLSIEDKERLRNHSGAFLSWDCPGCGFRLKYHVANSITASILNTDDVRTHSSLSEVEYRPAWLVKCHLYQNKSVERRESIRNDDDRQTITTERRVSNARRKSDARPPRASNPFFFGGPRRSKTDSYSDTYALSREREGTSKYGCPFCFATGKDYGHMDYRSGRELAEHIASRHNTSRPPSGLMLERYMVGLNGRCAENVRRWDLNIRSK